MTERLTVKGLTKSFGGLSVASNINLNLEAGARTALIGPNGAGKTTFVNLITGVIKPSAGEIYLDGAPLNKLSQAARVRSGLVRTFQVNRLFKDLTVNDNLRLAILQQQGRGMALLSRVDQLDDIDVEVERLLSMLQMKGRGNRILGKLAYGEQRLVEIAVALALRPLVLLLDEPAAGVPQSESGVILDAVESLPPDLAVLLIEHDMDLVFRFARRIAVLVSGALMMEGTPAEVASDERLKQIYFGRGEYGSRTH
jgi:branched-chain amino acid transport system ATP-binding protein